MHCPLGTCVNSLMTPRFDTFFDFGATITHQPIELYLGRAYGVVYNWHAKSVCLCV